MLQNVHNQVKYTPNLIANCIEENFPRNDLPVTPHDYLTNMSNQIIYESTGVSTE